MSMPSVIMRNVFNAQCHSKVHYAECLNAEYRAAVFNNILPILKVSVFSLFVRHKNRQFGLNISVASSVQMNEIALRFNDLFILKKLS